MTLTQFDFSNGYSLRSCQKVSRGLESSFLGLGITDAAAALFFAATAIGGLNGAIFEVSKRRFVPHLLYINALSIVVALTLTCIVVKYALYNGEAAQCPTVTKRLVQGTVALNFVTCFLFIMPLVFLFDPSGRTDYHSTEEYAMTWRQRFRFLCCNCDADPAEREAFAEVAQVFALRFRGYDIVPSDIAAGMLLLHGYQEVSRRILSNQVVFGAPPNGQRERKSTQARRSRGLSEVQRQQVRVLHEYSRYYMASYGWKLYQFEHCCTALPKLCLFDPCTCCRNHPGNHYGVSCWCDLTTVLKRTGIPEEDILLSSWNNDIFKPVHFVAQDPKTDTVVVCIRGTMSLMDCVTDFAALPEVVDVKDHETLEYMPEDYFVHGGMLESARYVWRSLESTGILHAIDDGRLSQKPVVVLGHSLGAGVAFILSILMWSDLPRLRKRLQCIGYAPPGGVMSEALVQYSKAFTVGTFMGYDMMPYLSEHTFDLFRENLFDVLAASKTNKSLLFLNMMRTHRVARCFHPSVTDCPSYSAESHEYREVLRQTPDSSVEIPKKLYPCDSLIHFRKAVTVLASKACCDWECEDIYYPCFTGPSELQMMLASPTMFTDHFPDRFYGMVGKALDRLERGELDRFYTNTPCEPTSPEFVAPMHFPCPQTESPRTNYGSEGITPTRLHL